MMKVYVHFASGFEEVEALTCVDVLRRAGIDAQMVSVTGELTVTGAHNINVETDLLFENATYDDCSMIVLPGGMPGATNLRDHEGLAAKIKEFAGSEKKLAAICAAPLALAAHGALQGKQATIYPEMEEYLEGAEATNETVTVDGNIITGMGPALAMEFALSLVEELLGKEMRTELVEDLLANRMKSL